MAKENSELDQGVNSRDIFIGEWCFNPNHCTLKRDYIILELRPKDSDLLVYLADNAGEVISLDDIINHVWNGVIVSEDSVYHAISQLRKALAVEDDSTEYIRTIAKKGYSLVAPVNETLGNPSALAQSFKSPKITLVAAIVIIVSLLFISIFFANDDTDDLQAVAVLDRSIAVLPFVDMSPDGDQEYFGDGMAEEILNLLVSIDELDVTSRTSSFAYKGTNKQIPEIAAELGVNYVVEGSIRRDGNQLRVTAQLIAVANDHRLWSETFDRELESIFAIQDEIGIAVSNALKIELVGGEPLREAPTSNMEAYALYLQGHQLFLKRGTSDAAGNIIDLENAIDLLNQSTALDSNFAEAWADLAGSYILLPGYTGKFDEDGSIARKASAAAERAINLQPNSSQAWAVKGFNHLTQYEFEDAELALVRATELNSKNESAWLWLGIVYRDVGNFNEALRCVEQAIKLAPDFAVNYFVQSRMLHSIGEVERAARQFDHVVNNLGYERGRFELALAAVGNNDPEKALIEIKARRSWLFGEEADEVSDDTLRLYINAYYDSSLRVEASKLLANDIAVGKELTNFGFYMLQDGEALVRKYETYSGNNVFNFARLYFPLNRSLWRQQAVKQFAIKTGLLNYWQNNSFPYFCRPVGKDDFECQDIEGNWP